MFFRVPWGELSFRFLCIMEQKGFQPCFVKLNFCFFSLYSGQAFDINPTKKFVQPVTANLPDVFDLTVSVKQNFGGNQGKQGKFCVHTYAFLLV